MLSLNEADLFIGAGQEGPGVGVQEAQQTGPDLYDEHDAC